MPNIAFIYVLNKNTVDPNKTVPSKSKASFCWALFSAKLIDSKIRPPSFFVEMVESTTLLRKGRLLLWQL